MARGKPGPLSASEAYEEAKNRIAAARKSKAKLINLAYLTYLKSIPPLDGLAHVTHLRVNSTRVADISPIISLPNLEHLDVYATQIKDLEGLQNLKKLNHLEAWRTAISDLTPLSGLPLQHLDISYTKVADLSPLSSMEVLSSLEAPSTKIRDLTPLARLASLKSLKISFTEVSDIGPLAEIPGLTRLEISKTAVSDLSPVVHIVGLLEGAKQGKDGGINFRDCPVKNRTIELISELPNPRRTEELFRALRENSDDKSEGSEVIPLEGVPTVYKFSLTSTNKIALTERTDEPYLPLPTSEADHKKRLEACRIVANDLAEEVATGRYQVRQEYLAHLQRYVSRLPTEGMNGNILLADASARTLRTLFAAEADILSPAFSAALKGVLEQHMGLRAYYPEIARFYSDVQSGRIVTPLPMDAVEAFTQGVKDYTPEVFEPQVVAAILETEQTTQITIVDSGMPLSALPKPPPDPLGSLEPQRAFSFTIAGTINDLWRVFLAGEKVNSAISAWTKAAQELGPYARIVLKWLHDFYGR